MLSLRPLPIFDHGWFIQGSLQIYNKETSIYSREFTVYMKEKMK